ncbi:MAG: signal peptidase I [Burkholderiales bacterium]
MDLSLVATIALVVSFPLVLWDVLSSFRKNAVSTIQPYMQSAYLVLFIAGFYLLVTKNILNFAAVLLIFTVITGVIWLWDAIRIKRSNVVMASATGATVEQAGSGRAGPKPEPAWLEIAKSFFPVILIVFMVRSFLVEPFKIPSGSMIPTLLIGDFILVNKFTYGIRLPVINKKIVPLNEPQRGDVMVFRYPEDTTIDYIKRIIGVPGDSIEYKNKRLTINGKPVPTEEAGNYLDVESDLSYQNLKLQMEDLGVRIHKTIQNPDVPPVHLGSVHSFPHHENCTITEDGLTCTVPAGHYFVMGDNRDNSKDSRYWGFVPDENIVGKAFMIWWHLGKFGRVGQTIN